jgi:hypothetical protein
MSSTRPITDEEIKIVFEYCEDNLLMPTNELVEIVAKKLDREPSTIRAIMWREGVRPRQEVRRDHYIDRIARQVSRDTGFSPEPYIPSPEFFRILKKLSYQRIVDCLTQRKSNVETTMVIQAKYKRRIKG